MTFLTGLQGWAMLGIFGALMLTITWWEAKKISNTQKSFLVADRRVGYIRAALSIAASWVWAPALFVASQKSFQQGVPGAMWFIIPNIATLIIFGFLAVRIRKLLPKGFTLPEFINRRFDKKTHIIYVLLFLSLQVCSVAVQLLAGASVIGALTGISIRSLTIGIAIIFLSYSLISGLMASVRTDVFQMILIIGTCTIIVPWVMFYAHGWAFLKAGIGGVSGTFVNAGNLEVAYSFGIIVSIGLLAGPIGDQQHWQRAFAIKVSEVKKAYFLSGLLFGIVPILLSLLGFVAAGMVRSGVLTVSDPQLCGVFVVHSLLPSWLVVLFVFMLLAGLASTGDSALCAASSLIFVDVYKKYINSQASDKECILVSRLTMISVTLLAVIVALVPNMSIVYLFLFYGTLRACDMMPTIFALFVKKLDISCLFWAVFISCILGLPAFVYGNYVKNIHIQVASVLAVLVLSACIPFLVTFFSRNKVDFDGNNIF